MLAVAAVGMFIYLFRFCWSAVFGSPDTCWILATGRYILEHHALPQHDVFSWTMPNQPWVLYQWLFEVLAALVFWAGGLWLVGLVAYMSVGLLLGYLLPRSWLRLGVPSWVTFAALILSLNLVWFYVRPQLASFFLIPLFLAILERNRLQPHSRAILALPPLMVLWANLHSFWFIGLLAVLCYGLFAPKGERRRLWMILAGCVVAVLVNPYGAGIVEYNISFLYNADFSGLGELKPPYEFQTLETHLFLLYCLAAWVVLIAKWRQLPAAGLIFAVICTAASLKFARFMPVAILGTWPYLGAALASFDWRQRYTQLAGMPYSQWLHLSAALGIPLAVWMIIVPNQQSALSALTYSRTEGLNFIASHRLPNERLYNDEQTGAQMLFLQLAPVFIDNRFDMYGKRFCDDWLLASHALPGWQAYLDKYSINAIALASRQDLVPSLMRDPDWLLAYDDGHMSYWIKNTPENRKVLDNWQVSPQTVARSSLPPAVRTLMADDLYIKHTSQGLALQGAHRPDQAAGEFRDAVAIAPNFADAHHNLIHALALAGNREELSNALRNARPFFWHFDGESTVKQTAFTAQEQARIDSWVKDATEQLMRKYHHQS